MDAPIEIVGAGPAGLAAALALRRRGRPVVVRERHRTVGRRFHGDFQGIESWSSRVDALEEMAELGLPVSELPVTPFREFDLWVKERGPLRIRARRPLFYLVRRGAGEDTLDTALLRAARAAGVEIRFGDDAGRLPRGGLVAAGPHAADIIAEGLAFRWEGEDLAVGVVDPELAPGGYAYLLRHAGRATLVTVLWRDFRSIHERLARTRAWFEERYGVRPQGTERFGGFGNFAPELPPVEGARLYLGESAGLQDYLWGFGMRYAFRSAGLAVQALESEEPARAYARALDDELRPMLRASLLNRALFEWLERRGWLPRLAASLARRDPHGVLRLLFNEGTLRALLAPRIARRYRSRLRDRRCHEEGCSCVWCRCGSSAGTAGAPLASPTWRSVQ